MVRRGYDVAAPTYLADRPDDGGDVALLLDLVAELPPARWWSTRGAVPASRWPAC